MEENTTYKETTITKRVHEKQDGGMDITIRVGELGIGSVRNRQSSAIGTAQVAQDDVDSAMEQFDEQAQSFVDRTHQLLGVIEATVEEQLGTAVREVLPEPSSVCEFRTVTEYNDDYAEIVVRVDYAETSTLGDTDQPDLRYSVSTGKSSVFFTNRLSEVSDVRKGDLSDIDSPDTLDSRLTTMQAAFERAVDDDDSSGSHLITTLGDS